MPFVKITKGKNFGRYRHNNKIYTQAQVALYYRNNGFPDKRKKANRKKKKRAAKTKRG